MKASSFGINIKKKKITLIDSGRFRQGTMACLMSKRIIFASQSNYQRAVRSTFKIKDALSAL